MSRQNFTIILILGIQIIGMITFDLLGWEYIYNMIIFGCPSCLLMLGILNLVSDDIMNWFGQPVFKKK